MIDHIGIAVSDWTKSTGFYDAALAPLGMRLITLVPEHFTGGRKVGGYGRDKAIFWLSQADGDGETGPGRHYALAAKSRGDVDAFHAAALAAGGTDNGGPGPRPHYHAHYYGAFVIDPDGNNIEAVCHDPG